MYQHKQTRTTAFRFRRYCRAAYAAYNSLHRVVNIGHLATYIADRQLHKSAAIAAVVEARETTNRAALDFYRQIYSDLNLPAHAMTVLEKAAATPNIPMGEVTRMLSQLLGLEYKK